MKVEYNTVEAPKGYRAVDIEAYDHGEYFVKDFEVVESNVTGTLSKDSVKFFMRDDRCFVEI